MNWRDQMMGLMRAGSPIGGPGMLNSVSGMANLLGGMPAGGDPLTAGMNAVRPPGGGLMPMPAHGGGSPLSSLQNMMAQASSRENRPPTSLDSPEKIKRQAEVVSTLAGPKGPLKAIKDATKETVTAQESGGFDFGDALGAPGTIAGLGLGALGAALNPVSRGLASMTDKVIGPVQELLGNPNMARLRAAKIQEEEQNLENVSKRERALAILEKTNPEAFEVLSGRMDAIKPHQNAGQETAAGVQSGLAGMLRERFPKAAEYLFTTRRERLERDILDMRRDNMENRREAKDTDAFMREYSEAYDARKSKAAAIQEELKNEYKPQVWKAQIGAYDRSGRGSGADDGRAKLVGKLEGLRKELAKARGKAIDDQRDVASFTSLALNRFKDPTDAAKLEAVLGGAGVPFESKDNLGPQWWSGKTVLPEATQMPQPYVDFLEEQIASIEAQLGAPPSIAGEQTGQPSNRFKAMEDDELLDYDGPDAAAAYREAKLRRLKP